MSNRPRRRPALVVTPLEDRTVPDAVVTNANPAGPGSLQSAVALTNATPGAETITFDPSLNGQTITLAATLVVNDRLTIAGPGAGLLTVSGLNTTGTGMNVRVFDVKAAANVVTFSGFTIADGLAGPFTSSQTDFDGGGIRNFADLTLDGVTVTNCVAAAVNSGGLGGGIYTENNLTLRNGTRIANNTSDFAGGGVATRFSGPALVFTIDDTTIENNVGVFSSGRGTGVYNGINSSLTVTRSVVRGQVSAQSGVGICNDGGDLVVVDSLFENNTLTSGDAVFGSAVASFSGTFSAAGSTFANNGDNGAGVVYVRDTPSFAVTNSTFTGNTGTNGAVGLRLLNSTGTVAGVTAVGNGNTTAGGIGVAFDLGTNLTLSNSLLAGNGTGGVFGFDMSADLYTNGGGTFTDGGGNVIGTRFDTADTTPLDPVVGPLAFNGGFTPTLALLAGSPALGVGVSGLAVDQRGFSRTGGQPLDAGAYQTIPPVALDSSISTPFGMSVTVQGPGVLFGTIDPDFSGPVTAINLVPMPAAEGTVSLNPDGGFTFTPAAFFQGVTSFTFQPFDGVVAGAVRIQTINVLPPGTPTAGDDVFSTGFNIPLSVPASGVLANDSTPNVGRSLTAAIIAGSEFGGMFTLNPDGSFAFTPTPGFSGPAGFRYKADDGAAQSAPAAVIVTVSPPALPIATADAFATGFNVPLSVGPAGVLANDSTTNPGGVLAATLIAGSQVGGTPTLNPDGSFAFSPTPGFFGNASFQYIVTDGFASAGPVSVTVAVSPPATPTAGNDRFSTGFNVPLSVPSAGVLANDGTTNPGGVLRAQFVAGSAVGGAVTLNLNGGFAFTPANGFNGNASFQYTLSDGFASAGPVNVTITVAPPAVPTAVADAFVTAFETPVTVPAPGVLANDGTTNPGGVLTARVVPGSAVNGTATLNPDGSFTFTPDPLFVGVGSFRYFVGDGFSSSLPVTVTVTVAGPGTPVATADSFATGFGVPVTVPGPGILANDTTPNAGRSLTASLVAGSTVGGVVGLNADGTFTFTPDAGFSGAGTFAYTASDGAATSAPAVVTVRVAAPALPTAGPDAFATPFQTPISIAAPGVRVNDSTTNPGSLGLTAALVPGSAVGGTVSFNADGSFTFTPVPGFRGDAGFQYTVNDGFATSAPAGVTITVAAPGVPSAGPDAFATPFGVPLNIPNPGILVNDSTPNARQTLVARIVPASAVGGTVVVNSDGSFAFTPAALFSGDASFRYVADDGTAVSLPAVVTIAVAPPGTPTVVNPAFATPFGTPVVIAGPGVLAGAVTPNAGRTLTAAVVPGSAVGGTVVVNPDGSFTFTPAAGFSGTASFRFTATDGAATSAPGTATIAVAAANTPTAVPDAFTGAFGLPLTIRPAGVLANDTTPNAGRTLTAAFVQDSAVGGGVTLSADGGFVFQPAAGFSGTASFQYTASDGVATSAAATVTIVIPPAVVPPPPAPATVNLFAVGAGAGGGPRIRVFNTDGTPRMDFFAFDPRFGGGVRVATGDVNGDGVDDIAAVPGPGGEPRVRVFDGVSGAVIADFLTYEPGFTNGLFVALGDVTGDGRADIVTGTGSLGGPRVQVYDGATFARVRDFFAYDATFRGGVRVAVGDVDGDGKGDIVTGAGVSGSPHVKVFSGPKGVEGASFFAADADYRGGVFVAVARGGSGPGAIVTGTDSSPNFAGTLLADAFPTLPDTDGVTPGGPISTAAVTTPADVRMFVIAGVDVELLARGEAYPGFAGGVRVSSLDPTPGGDPVVVIAPAAGVGGRVRRLRATDGVLVPVGSDLPAFEDGFLGSVYVG